MILRQPQHAGLRCDLRATPRRAQSQPVLRLPKPCAWAMGHEGQGVGDALMDMAQHRISIAQPGGEESLNVGAAAAICLDVSSVSMLKRRE